MKDNWLIEYAEGEGDPDLRQQMKQALLESSEERAALDSIRGAKERIRNNAESLPTLDDAYFDRLHDRIMAAVDTAKPIEKPRFGYRLRRKAKAWLAYGSLIGLAAAFVIWDGPAESDLNSTQDIAAFISQAPDEIMEMTNYQPPGDFLVDVAAENFQNLSAAELSKVMGRN